MLRCACLHRVATASTGRAPLSRPRFLGVQKFVDIALDPAKDRADVIKHGISLLAAEGFDWDTALEREDDRFDYGAVRFAALGLIGNRLHVRVFTESSQPDAIRATSLRPADKHAVTFCRGQV